MTQIIDKRLNGKNKSGAGEDISHVTGSLSIAGADLYLGGTWSNFPGSMVEFVCQGKLKWCGSKLVDISLDFSNSNLILLQYRKGSFGYFEGQGIMANIITQRNILL